MKTITNNGWKVGTLWLCCCQNIDPATLAQPIERFWGGTVCLANQWQMRGVSKWPHWIIDYFINSIWRRRYTLHLLEALLSFSTSHWLVAHWVILLHELSIYVSIAQINRVMQLVLNCFFKYSMWILKYRDIYLHFIYIYIKW